MSWTVSIVRQKGGSIPFPDGPVFHWPRIHGSVSWTGISGGRTSPWGEQVSEGWDSLSTNKNVSRFRSGGKLVHSAETPSKRERIVWSIREKRSGQQVYILWARTGVIELGISELNFGINVVCSVEVLFRCFNLFACLLANRLLYV